MSLFRRSLRIAATGLGLCVAAAPAVSAFDHAVGYTTTSLNMRAGPGVAYPWVATIPYQGAVNVYGCTAGYGWCDVGWGVTRGWASGSYLQMDYQNRRQPVVNSAVVLGLPLLVFALDSYWSNHYQKQYFYATKPRYRTTVYLTRNDWRDNDGWHKWDDWHDEHGWHRSHEAGGLDHNGKPRSHTTQVTAPTRPDPRPKAAPPRDEPKQGKADPKRDDTPGPAKKQAEKNDDQGKGQKTGPASNGQKAQIKGNGKNEHCGPGTRSDGVKCVAN